MGRFTPIRFFALLMLCAVLEARDPGLPSLDQLFTRPYVWGTEPQALRWSRNGDVLIFLWNERGGRFLDLYAWHAGQKKRVRLTELEPQAGEELTRTAAEKDERRRQYLPPEAGLSSAVISDDGKQAAFGWKGDLYTVDTSGTNPPLRLTRTKGLETSPQLSPDGKRLGSIRGGQLILQNLGTGQIWQPFEVEEASLEAYDISPDGARIVYRTEKGKPRQIPLPNYSGRAVTANMIDRSLAGDEPQPTSVYVAPADGGGKPVRVERGDEKWPIETLKWSPDSKRILIAQFSPDWKTRQLLIADPETGKTRKVFEETDPRWVDYGFAGWSEDSTRILFTSERTGWAHLYIVSAEGGEPKQLTEGKWEIRTETFGTDPQWAGGWIWYGSTEAGTAQRHFYRIRPDGTGRQKLTEGEGVFVGLVSDDGRNVATLRSDEKNPFDLWVNGERVTKSPQPAFYSYAWPDVRYVQFPSKGDGKPVPAKMLLPPGYDPSSKAGKKWPAIVYVHGAGIATSVLKQWGSYNRWRYVFNAYLASRGYVVLDVDYRGSTGYGRDWRSDVYLHMGGRDLEDILAGADYLKSLGNVDGNRLGIWGVSYGGFMTAMALFQSPGTFKAGSAWAGVYDWENYNAGYTAQRLTTPKENPEAYKRSSPIHFAKNLQDNLLIIHGMVDDNVLFQDAVQLTEKLIHEGKQFEHFFYPEESHAFIRDQTWKDALRRTASLFDRHLKP